MVGRASAVMPRSQLVSRLALDRVRHMETPGIGFLRALALTLAAVTVPGILMGQDGDELRLAERLKACLAKSGDAQELREALGSLVAELDNKGLAREAIDVLMDDLAGVPAGQPPQLKATSATRLLELIGLHRRKGRPELMLPAILILESLQPNDPRVLYAKGEAYGVKSAVFDAEIASDAFNRLYEQLLVSDVRPSGPAGCYDALATFLPELPSRGPAKAKDDVAWLRERLLQFRETLSEGRAISIWVLSDSRIQELSEELQLFVRKGDQARVASVLEQMRALAPGDPASCYMLAQVLSSLGPKFDAGRASDLFREFRELTEEARLRNGERPGPELQAEEIHFRMAEMLGNGAKDSLSKLREVALERASLLRDVAASKDPAVGLSLLHPDLDLDFPDLQSLQAEVQRLQKRLNPLLSQLESKNAELRAQRERLERVESLLQGDPRNPRLIDARLSLRGKVNTLEFDISKLQKRTGVDPSRLDSLAARFNELSEQARQGTRLR